MVPCGKESGCPAVAVAAAAMLSVAASRAEAGGVLSIAYEDATFTNPLVIDNPYWPLSPDGAERTFTYLAETEDGCVKEEATVYAITDTKVLSGAWPYTNDEAIIVEDIGYIDEECTGAWVKTEHTFDWYRQDDNENIWYVGELSLDYETEGCGNTAIDPSEADKLARPQCYGGSWEAGLEWPEGSIVAEAGIVVPGDYPMGMDEPPLAAGTHYLQELAEGAMDVAKVLQTDAKVKYKIDGETHVFFDCRVTKEYSSLAPGAVEQKNYCPYNDGLVLIEESAGDKTVLVVLDEVSPPLD